MSPCGRIFTFRGIRARSCPLMMQCTVAEERRDHRLDKGKGRGAKREEMERRSDPLVLTPHTHNNDTSYSLAASRTTRSPQPAPLPGNPQPACTAAWPASWPPAGAPASLDRRSDAQDSSGPCVRHTRSRTQIHSPSTARPTSPFQLTTSPSTGSTRCRSVSPDLSLSLSPSRSTSPAPETVATVPIPNGYGRSTARSRPPPNKRETVTRRITSDPPRFPRGALLVAQRRQPLAGAT